MERITFSSSIREIEETVFDNCKALKEVVFTDGLKKIGKQAFTGCSSIEYIKFPSTLRRIEPWAFHDCRKLRVVVLNKGLEEIGDDAFHIAEHNMCSSLGSIEFPSTLQSVCNCAFSGCNRLKKLLLNEGLQTIGGAAFSQCYRLRSVEFPSTLCEVGPYAFQDCTQLNKVVLNEGLRTVKHQAFQGCSSHWNTLSFLAMVCRWFAAKTDHALKTRLMAFSAWSSEKAK